MTAVVVVASGWLVVELLVAGRARLGGSAPRSARGPLVIVAAIGGAVAVWSFGVVALFAIAGLGALMWWRRRRRVADGEAALVAARAEVADLLAVVVGAGGSVHDALIEVADRGPPVVRAPIAELLRDAARGLGLVEALRRSDGLGPTYRRLLASLVAAERDGVPLGTVVGRLGDEAREAAALRQRTRSQQLPVQLLAPLTICCLPAVIVGALVPLALAHLGAVG